MVQNDNTSELRTMLESKSTDKGAALMDISSPQFHSYAWLVEDTADGWYADERMLQRYALGTLYFATNGVHWSNSENWITSADECAWYGISGCDDADLEDIVSIELKGNRLEGTIPPEIFEFIKTMVVFNVASNSLDGPVPHEIGMLTDINILELAENQLTSIPDTMGNLGTVCWFGS